MRVRLITQRGWFHWRLKVGSEGRYMSVDSGGNAASSASSPIHLRIFMLRVVKMRPILSPRSSGLFLGFGAAAGIAAIKEDPCGDCLAANPQEVFFLWTEFAISELTI